MSDAGVKRIGLIVGQENEWPSAFMDGINGAEDGMTAEMVKLGGTSMNELCQYDLIIDRMSHEIPYYRTYVKYAAMHGAYVINDPFVWSIDSRFFGTAVASRLGLSVPITIALPNKDVEADVVPDSFRNLSYPMDWENIISQVGVPAIFKEVQSGRQRLSYRVHSVDELIQRYDESGTRNMMIQSLIQGGRDIHCYVIGQEHVLPMYYDREERVYAPDAIGEDDPLYADLVAAARALTQAYGYDINMVEFVAKDGTLTLINCSNPVPVIERELLARQQFDWVVDHTIAVARARLLDPPPRRFRFRLGQDGS